MPEIIKNLSIKAKLFSIVIISVAGFVLFGYIGLHTLDLLKVNGPLYQRIIQGKDSIADVLPPPKYIIESYLIAHRMLIEKNPKDMEKLFQGSSRLEKEYIQRQRFWSENLPEGELKNELVRLSHKPAMEFFKLRNEAFYPLIINGEIEKAKGFISESLEPFYEEHRRHIDRVVEIAKGMNEAQERYAKKIAHERTALLAAWGVILVAASALLSLYFANQIAIHYQEIEGRVNERTELFEAANRELQEANAMNQSLLQTIPFTMDIVDEDANILAISPKLEALFGKGIIGQKCWSVFRDNKMQCADCPLRKEVDIGKAETIETKGLFGGRIFQVTHSGLMYQGRKAILEIFQDITERKIQEQELREAGERLKAAHGQLVQSAKMASIGQLAGGVAHEINNPLTGILNNVQLIKMLMKNKDGFSPGEFTDTIDMIEESALRCAGITRSLLDFSYSGKTNFCPLSLNELVEKVFSLIGNAMKLQNINIAKQLQPDLPHIFGDSQLLQQVVFDIAANARWAILKKSPYEGGLITVKTWCGLGEKKAYLSIADTGVGIPEENMGKIFDPFFTTKPIGEGTGLGLSIVYSIIKQHQGSISAESQIDKGTSFTIALPMLDMNEAAVTERGSNGNPCPPA